jgi:deoxyribodipyrimidine photo-lyase
MLSIIWFRKDLRITDHPALLAVQEERRSLLPLYILSDWKSHQWTGAKRQHFLCGCLDSLKKNLQALQSDLCILHGKYLSVLETVFQELKPQELHVCRDYEPHSQALEQNVTRLAQQYQVQVVWHTDRVVHAPDSVLTDQKQPYRVYTPYSKKWLSLPVEKPKGKPKSLPPLPKLSATLKNLQLLESPTLAHWNLSLEGHEQLIDSGEKAARARLSHWIQSQDIQYYAERRNIPSTAGTSSLSADLRFGLLSPREIVYRCKQAHRQDLSPDQSKSIHTYLKEIAWRDFYIAILHYFPQVFDEEFQPTFRGMHWDGNESQLLLWQRGETGFPIVDAGMRQLNTTGWMHNRVRMIVAMFLTKDLHLHWWLGERYFMQHLIDGENASNNGGWQWSAGTGADAAPYFRIQNPWTQTKTYDPEGLYIKQWIPELKNTHPSKFFAPPDDQRPIAPNYPYPIVEHAIARQRTLQMFSQYRNP